MNTLDYLDGAASITIKYSDIQALLQRDTNNPIAEDEIPAMLREALGRGIIVYVEENGKPGVYKLQRKGNGFIVARDGTSIDLPSC